MKKYFLGDLKIEYTEISEIRFSELTEALLING